MTKEEFRAKAREVVDNETYFDEMDGIPYHLFDYTDYREMRIACMPWGPSAEADMLLDDFLDELYDKIKGNLK